MLETDFNDGFKHFKNYIDKPMDCRTILKVEGYKPKLLAGFTLSTENGAALNETELKEIFIVWLKSE